MAVRLIHAAYIRWRNFRICYQVLPQRHSGGAKQLLWFVGAGGHSMTAILKRLVMVPILLVTTLFLLTASGGSDMRVNCF